MEARTGKITTGLVTGKGKRRGEKKLWHRRKAAARRKNEGRVKQAFRSVAPRKVRTGRGGSNDAEAIEGGLERRKGKGQRKENKRGKTPILLSNVMVAGRVGDYPKGEGGRSSGRN